jgi:hypothetical protein
VSRRKRARRRLILLWGAAVGVVVLGLLLVAVGQRAYERQLFQAATAGGPCTALKPADAAAAMRRPLRHYAFADLRFAYGRGDIDCQMMKPGRALGDDGLAVCAFQYPDVLLVQGHGVQAAYSAPLGQVAVVQDRGRLVCHARML